MKHVSQLCIITHAVLRCAVLCCVLFAGAEPPLADAVAAGG
jgi:hypothetical protein